MLVEWFHKGGIVMWPLLVCSIVGLAVILDRYWVISHSSIHFGRFIKKLKSHLRSEGARCQPDWLSNKQTAATLITNIYYTYLNSNAKVRDEVLKREGGKYLNKLSKNLKLLSSIAQVSPLLGLLGTVCGLVLAFYKIESLGGHIQPTDLAGGIWEALLTTVVGLTVGIPCLLAHQYFQSQIDRRANEMTETVSQMDEVLGQTNQE